MGGDSNSAQRAAEQAEAQRRALVAATQQQIESIYGGPQRETDIGDLVSATRTYLQDDLNRQNVKTRRAAKFAAARSGQTMGAADITTQRDIGEQYLRGGLEAERRAQGAGAQLRAADQASKQNLFAMAQAGLDTTTAARQAGEAMRVGLAGARASATESGIGDIFQQMGDVYRTSREGAGARKAEKDYGLFYQPSYFSVPRR